MFLFLKDSKSFAVSFIRRKETSVTTGFQGNKVQKPNNTTHSTTKETTKVLYGQTQQSTPLAAHKNKH